MEGERKLDFSDTVMTGTKGCVRCKIVACATKGVMSVDA